MQLVLSVLSWHLRALFNVILKPQSTILMERFSCTASLCHIRDIATTQRNDEITGCLKSEQPSPLIRNQIYL